ncbi:MerR family transcriptional regulator [Psychrosphaera aestuarii]|uniref:MerR family transcriptional regulator n=1 Tax=Psychrosphaera aestuarii TaxID=1266052 RepID=UPI001B33A98F|nr:MerR family DNA-binding transcriptional regulator [Psychrosphaera aestuarii]
MAATQSETSHTQDTITYTIGELAKEFDITTRSIRFYEDAELLSPARNGQTRVYSAKDRTRLKLVLRGKRLGFSLQETKTIFELYDNEDTEEKQLHIMLELIEEKKQRLIQQQKDIADVLADLSELESGCKDSLAKL